MNSSNIIQRSGFNASRGKVKLEIEEEEEHSHKKPKSSFHQLWNTESSRSSSQLNSLDEPPSPLGLRLRKTPSLLDLIQMRLSHGDQPNPNPNSNPLPNNDDLMFSAASGTDKLKASNFPASLLRIGTWEYASQHEGDLVAKCYFAKHKLVWEILQNGLKSKIEIQWSDIMLLKANYPEDGPGTLDIVLACRPLFFRETNPQPRKHTLWQATSDFTSGQASIHRRHFLQCPHGLLNKHFEKLIQCDPRLKLLSGRPETVLNSPYFEAKGCVFEEPCKSRWEELDQLKSDFISTFPGYQDDTPSSSKKQVRSPECPVPSLTSGKFTEKSEAEDLSKTVDCNKFRGGLHASMSMSDLVNHIGHCISGEPNGETLEEMAQYLLSDSHQHACTSDEKSVMSRVNSFCSLLHKNPPTTRNDCTEEQLELGGEETTPPPSPTGGGMSRKDSVGDLLLHLPRIASLPHFLFHIAQDSYYQAR